MGEVRAFSKRQRWTSTEVSLLAQSYATTPRAALAALFPGRPIRSVECKANGLGLARVKKPKRTRNEHLAAKREGMARRRAEDPEAVRQMQRAWSDKNRESLRARNRAYLRSRFFWARALRLKQHDAATHVQLARLWKQQRGLCALTGRKLDRSAEIDHKLPKSKGGGDEIENLQWVCKQVNRAKRDLTDEEFALLCTDVMRWVGERIDLFEELKR